MLRGLFFSLAGYLCGSILFAKVFGRIFIKADITENTSDSNPGTANAFKNGGFLCGTLTLLCDLSKGFLPVFLYCRGETGIMLALVIAAPVLGHIFPLFGSFKGGKGIATTFGALLGLFPDISAAALLAVWFIFFSVILRIVSHYHRTFITYIFTELSLLLYGGISCIWLGFSIIFTAVSIRLIRSGEEKEPIEVKLLWTH